jgi:hypothetical protein
MLRLSWTSTRVLASLASAAGNSTAGLHFGVTETIMLVRQGRGTLADLLHAGLATLERQGQHEGQGDRGRPRQNHCRGTQRAQRLTERRARTSLARAMQNEIIIECGTEGGLWTLVGSQGANGWKFRVIRDEGTLFDFVDEENREGLGSWEESIWVEGWEAQSRDR